MPKLIYTAFAIAALLVANSAWCQSGTFPVRPIRMVVGFTPGGQPDITARMLAPKLYEAFGQQVIVDNRPGAGGVVAAKIVADAAPDGHITDLISGRLQFFMSPLASAVSLVRDGKIRALAVTAKKRVAVYADVPTLAESALPGYQWDSWSGLLAPAKTPRAIIDKLNREITKVLNQPEIQQRLLSMGAEAAPNKPAEFDKLIAEQVAMTIKLARQAGIKPE